MSLFGRLGAESAAGTAGPREHAGALKHGRGKIASARPLGGRAAEAGNSSGLHSAGACAGTAQE
eukprot:10582164-Lingulodinium_polyedra.AAC.1